MGLLSRVVAALALLTPLASAPPALAQANEPGCRPEMASYRLPIQRVNLGKDEVRLTFVGHATFLIETPAGVKVATDYNDYVRPQVTPDVATMNKAHSSHYTLTPEPGIEYVLHGWLDGSEKGADHDVVAGDTYIRNVPTDIRGWGGTMAMVLGGVLGGLLYTRWTRPRP